MITDRHSDCAHLSFFSFDDLHGMTATYVLLAPIFMQVRDTDTRGAFNNLST